MANLLPFDLIFDIFLRLPVKSLVRFKCVCKSWYALIESSDFIKSYKKHSPQTSCNLSLLFTPKLSESSDRCLWIYRMIPGLQLLSQNGLATNLYLPQSVFGDGFLDLVGSCDGLICLRNPFFLALVNPSTHTFQFLPCPEPRDVCWYGFGYDSQSDDYKIVAIAGWGSMVYSFRTGLWGGARCLSIFPCINGVYGLLFAGQLHWVACCRKLLLRFDLHNEEWSALSLPNYDYGDDLWWVELAIFDGSLCVIFSIKPSSRFRGDSSHVWVMKEYGVEETWTKLFCLPFVKALPLTYAKQRCEVLFSRGFSQGLFIWNTKEETQREIEVPIMHYSQVTVCGDSLAPLAHYSCMLLGKEIKEKRRHKEQENQNKQDRRKKKPRYIKNFYVQ